MGLGEFIMITDKARMIWEKGGHLLPKNAKCQVVNVERMLELTNHYFVTITIMTGSGQNHKFRGYI